MVGDCRSADYNGAIMTIRVPFSVRTAYWPQDALQLQQVRRVVFIDEQQVPEELEWDADDALSLHALALDDGGTAIATGRLLPDGHIGRMAVLREWRRRGVGGAILSWLIGEARARGDRFVQLNAQTHALDFYAWHGFTVCSEIFIEAGIPHRKMKLTL